MQCDARLLRSGGGLGSSVIPAFRSDGEFTVAPRTSIHFHLTIATLVFRRCRLISNGVLAANIASHFTADGVHFVQRLGKESEAAGSLRHDLQGAFGVLRVLFLLQDANGVNGGSAVALQTPHRLLESFGALVVVSVGNDKNDFLLEFRILFQVIVAGNDRVVNSPAPPRASIFSSPSCSFLMLEVKSWSR